MFRKLPALFIALLLFTEASLFPISAYSEEQVVAPAINETPGKKKTFSDKAKADGKDASIGLSKALPNDKDSCFPILYGEKETITLDFQNANIRNLFRIISEFSGFNVIFSPEVQGSVNIRITDMPWNQALEVILANSDLGRKCYGNNVVRIANRKTLAAEIAEEAAKITGADVKDSDSCFPVLYGDKELVSLDFQNASISNLFRVISEVSGFNLILSDGVSGAVNIRMLDVPWNNALEIILDNSSLGRECFVKGTVRIAARENLNKAPKILGDEKKGGDRLLGKELEDIPPVAMSVYEKIKNGHPELLKKMNHFESVFKNKEMLEGLSDKEYEKVLAEYKDTLARAAEIKITKTPLQKDYESIRLTGVIMIKKERVALFETFENKGYSVRKGDSIGPNFGYVDEIKLDQVLVLEKARDYLGNIKTKQHTIELFEGKI
jgi:Tfp pilus assembly protein PilP